MRRNLFKRLTAGALALLMLGTALPSGSDFTGLFSGTDIVASAETAEYTLVYNAGDGSGTMKAGTVSEDQWYQFPKCTFTAPEGKVFSHWEMSGADGIYYLGSEIKIASNCAMDGVITVTAHWQDYKCGDNAYWSFDENTGKLTISGTGAMYDYQYVQWYLPSTAPWSQYFASIKSVEISEGITKIGEYAFFYCIELTDVTIPASVTDIGYAAFYSSGPSKPTFAQGSKLETVEAYAFTHSYLTEISLPEGLKTIEDSAFYDNVNLKTVTIPSSVTNIGDSVFDLSNKIDIVYCYADPANLSIGSTTNSFKDNKGTRFVVLEQYLEKYLSKFGKMNVTFASIKKCGDNAYWNFDAETGTLTINGTGEMYDYSTGDEHSPWHDKKDSIKQIVIEQGVTTVGENAFADCGSLTDITLPSSVTKIGAAAFSGCKALKSITIPSSIVTLSDAFKGCNDLDSIYLVSADPSKLTWKTSGDEFKPNKATKCYVPKGSLDAYKAKFADNNVTLAVEPCKVTVNKSGSGSVIVSSPTAHKPVWKENHYMMLGKKVSNYNETIDAVNCDTVELSINLTVTGGSSLQLFESDSEWKRVTELGKVTSSPFQIKTSKTYKYDGQKTSTYYFVAYASGLSRSYEGRYALTINWSEPADTLTADAGREVILDVKPAEHFKLKGLTVKDAAGKTVTVKDGKFVLPDNDVTVTAVFEEITYTVSFVNDDGSLLQSIKVPEGEIPSYTGAPPTKKATAQYTYTFKGWDKALSAVKGDITYTAIYDKEVNKYTVTFYDEDGKTVLQNGKVAYGETPKYTGKTPTKPSTAQYEYTFKGWDKKITAVKGKATYKAVYESKRIGVAVNRLAGRNRFLTAVEISKASFETADTVVLAFGMNYADALAGVPLANKLNAPILLTYKDTLDSATLAELVRLKAKKVIILGGTGAINEKVEAELKQNGLETERVAGESRFGTAAAVAEQLTETPEEIFFVYAFNFADALSASTVAAIKGAPIIYLRTNGDIDADTAVYLESVKGKVKKAYVIGGDGVISDDMMNKAGDALGITPTRLAGKNRYETCVEVNKAFDDIFESDELCIATGKDFPDALAGGVFAARKKAPLLLAAGQISETQSALLKSKAPMTLDIFGGIGAVPDAVVEQISTACIS